MQDANLIDREVADEVKALPEVVDVARDADVPVNIPEQAHVTRLATSTGGVEALAVDDSEDEENTDNSDDEGSEEDDSDEEDSEGEVSDAEEKSRKNPEQPLHASSSKVCCRHCTPYNVSNVAHYDLHCLCDSQSQAAADPVHTPDYRPDIGTPSSRLVTCWISTCRLASSEPARL